MDICDLHTHTTASDGSDTPSKLVQEAKYCGLRAVAITDHDTVEGLDEAIEQGKALGVEVIPGVELSVLFPKGNMHILGYYIQKDSPYLRDVLGIVQEARRQRNPRMIKRLQELGIPITLEQLEEMAKGGQIGRPHFARALVKMGVVKSVGDAFKRYLARGAKAYVPKSVLSPKEAIDAIHKAGGLSVLAHAFSLGCKHFGELESIVEGLATDGLDGIECYYSEHSHDLTRALIGLARRLGLAVTGGSDYHGKAKPYIHLGRGKENLNVPYECVLELKERLNRGSHLHT